MFKIIYFLFFEFSLSEKLKICAEEKYFVEKSGLVEITCKVPGEVSKYGIAKLFFRDSTQNSQKHDIEFEVTDEILQVAIPALINTREQGRLRLPAWIGSFKNSYNFADLHLTFMDFETIKISDFGPFASSFKLESKEDQTDEKITKINFVLKVEEFDEKIKTFLDQMKHQIEIDIYENFRHNSKKIWTKHSLPGNEIRMNVENEKMKIRIDTYVPFTLESFDFIELRLGEAKIKLYKQPKIPFIILASIMIILIIVLITCCVLRKKSATKMSQFQQRYFPEFANSRSETLKKIQTLPKNGQSTGEIFETFISEIEDPALGMKLYTPLAEFERTAVILKKGRFSTTFLGKLKNRNVAVKIFNSKERIISQDIFYRKTFESVNLISQSEHRHVLSTIGISLDTDFSAIVISPLMDEKDLKAHLLRKENFVTYRDAINFLHQVAEGVWFLHSQLGYIHQDIRAENCLLERSGPGQLNIRICASEFHGLCSTRNKSKMKNIISFRNLAPEILNFLEFSEKSDSWAFGLLIWEVTTRGKTPFAEIESWDELRKLI